MDKTTSLSELTSTRLSFPTEFPYEFDSPAFTSPGDSTDESSDDEEDFLAELSRRLAPSTQRLPPPSKPPSQSTLHRNITPNLTPSQPHATSFRRDSVFDVISAAAGEVARRQNAAFQTERYIQQQRLLHQMWLCSKSRTNGALTRQHAGTLLKRPSTGTGVFLPRRYPTTAPSEPIMKQVPVNATALFQPKVNPPQNLGFNELTSLKSRHIQFEYECMVARSRLHAGQGNYRAVGCLNQERRLPQDWMY